MDWLALLYGFRQPEEWYEVRKAQFKSNGGGGLLCTQYTDSTHEALRDYRPEFRWLPWKFHTAPKNFWSNARNRRSYMDWLAVELGFQRPEDWYDATKRTFADHGGAGLLHGWYGDSVLAAVREHNPDHHWLAWLFKESPRCFWHDAQNRRSYMTWLGEQLQYVRPDDWYAITQKDFDRNKGSALLNGHFGGSPQKAVREFLPHRPWTPWLFTSVPQRFWHDGQNRMSYLKWLGKELNFESSSDWFRLVSNDFKRNHGGGLLGYYAGGSLGKALTEALRESGSRHRIVWPMIQLIECSASGRDPVTLFRALVS